MDGASSSAAAAVAAAAPAAAAPPAAAPPGAVAAAAPPPNFPAAAQPSIIRAHQKDEVYAAQLAERCHDAVARILGPRAALRWARETRLAADLLYHGLTTGAGSATLGEEYCGLAQAAAGPGAPPGAARRGALVLLQAVGPYLAERGGSGGAAWRPAEIAPVLPAPADEASTSVPGWRGEVRACAAAVLAAARAAGAPIARHYAAAAALLQAHAAVVLRLHLALFYLTGSYYQLSKRLAGVRLLSLGRSPGGRPSYRLLGVLLLAQLGAVGGAAAAARWGAPPLRRWLAARQAAAGNAGAAKPRRVALLDEDGAEVAEEDAGAAAAAADAEAEVPAGRRCPLCLSRRVVPTATPCGHVFCWHCVAEWTAHKPECCVCRAEAPPQQLVPVRGADM